MKPHNVFNELQNCQNDIPIFRKLISTAPLYDSTDESVTEWQTILAHIVEITSNNSELGNERILLACHAFHALLPTQCESLFVKDVVIGFQRLDSSDLRFLEKQYAVSDLELFKLLNAYGYLQVDWKNVLETCFEYDALLIIFDVIYRNCMKYTRYTYFAYKVLSVWLKRFNNTTDARFWNKQNCILERKLEAVIFSNWFNALPNLCKQNAEIFNTYLQIMSQKYKERFLDDIYLLCLRDMSWQNETKYIILAEILQVHDIKIRAMKDSLLDLCNSLTKNSLRCGGTKLYLTILRRLSEDEWKEMFGEVMKLVIDRWESKEYEDHNALQSLFNYWLEPTFEMYKNVLLFLWDLCENTQAFFRSHLQRMAAKIHVELPQTQEIDNYINDKEEIIRLNAFAVLCYRIVELIDINEGDPFLLIKQFLWFNANTATILMREGIIKYFRILCSNILKAISVKTDCAQSISKFMEWLHEYFLDCFEIGSCYQRKILALNLYRTLLSFTNNKSHKSYARHKEYLHYITAIDKYLKITDSWKFLNKESLFLLLRLVLDSTLDVRQLAATLILEYFEKDALSTTEKRILYNCAWEHCNSSKFYKIESGAILVKIMAYWLPLNEVSKDAAAVFSDNDNNDNNILTYSSYSDFLLNEAKCQLTQIKSDILKAIVQNKPFYGVLTALLAVAFRGGPENWILTSQFTEELLDLLKNTVDFFLSMFSTKASSTVYSSSFAEMGLAIDEKIKTSEIEGSDNDELQLSPAHQVLVSCIWMSLKISCEIASEIGLLMQSSTQVKRSMDIIVTVLLKCRHKGVVECAGVAIANLSKRLYNKEEYSDLPKTYLTCLLEDTGKSLHLTRRGAGLTIMFHKLVVSDNRKSRFTVHLAVQTLLRSLENSVAAVRHVEVGEDSPWAKRLHFLRALVADKEIHAQLVPYMEDICLICFKYMESDIWTIRNASLQLYGAVVPRLVGQCTEKGDKRFDFGNGYSVNHFVTHYPILTSHMWAQLRDSSMICETSNSALRSYAGIVHSLIILSKLSISGCDLVDYPAKVFVTKCKHMLLAFLGNPMIHVRHLAAKAYTALTPFNNITSQIDAIEKRVVSCRDANISHGYLLTCRYLRRKFIHDTRGKCEATEDCGKVCRSRNLNNRYFDVLEAWNTIHKHKKAAQPCYILETLFLQESHSCVPSIDSFQYILSVIECIVSSQKIQPGFFQFVGYYGQLYAVSFTELKLYNCQRETIRNILNSSCIEQGIEFLKSLSYCVPLLEFILKYLTLIRSNYHQLLLDEVVTFTLRTIRHASLETNELEFDGDEIIEEFNEAEMVVANSNIARVKNALILAFSKRETLINQVLSHVSDTCTNEKQSVRLTAAEYIELALHRFAQLEDGNKLTIIRCCLILLKDEIAEIREIVSTSLQTHVFHEYVDFLGRRLQHEEIVYQRLLSDVIRYHVADNSTDFIQYFTHAVRDGDSNVTIENPFHHKDSAFHKEESKFLNTCFLYDSSEDNCSIREDSSDVIHAIQTRHFRKLQKKAGLCYDDLRVILYLEEIDYMMRKRDIIIQQWK